AKAAAMKRREIAGRVRMIADPSPWSEPRLICWRTVAPGHSARHRGKYLSGTQSAVLGTGGWRGPGVFRLVHADLPAAGQREIHEAAPSLLLERAGPDLPCLHHIDECLHVVHEEIELVPAVLFGRMDGHLGCGQAEDEPSPTGVHVRQSEDVAQERTVSLRIGAVDDRVLRA